ncbi:MAG: von Willebrand factor type A domain-containing protein [Clostridia bacterium]|nr:von Willebrand factor type A domain-containing protein [Clostridia bacterium]
MKKTSLFSAFSLVDDMFIAEAAPSQSKKNTRVLWRVAIPTIAACLAFALILPLSIMVYSRFTGDAADCTTSASGSNFLPCVTAPEEDMFDASAGAPDEEWGALLPAPSEPDPIKPGQSGDSYTETVENGFVSTVTNNKSFFSIDYSTASYPNIRALVEKGIVPQVNAVRMEEMLNYFNYDYATPTDDAILGLTASLFDTPFNAETKLLTVGLKAEEIEFSEVENNLVFLIDVSGSMSDANKLPLVQQAFSLLVENLNPADRVSVVTYASSDRVALSGAYGYEKNKILAVIDDLMAGGSTAGSAGISTAYQLAKEYFIEGGNNRVILMTDGDFNVGVTDNKSLEEFIADKRKTGVYFSVYGFGMGNWKADKMETLALNGNGAYGYIDSIKEARRALVEEIGGSLVTVAKDVKAGIEFNPDYIESYRLIGYENKLLTEEEFENTETDAGELGAGHTVTVVYEVKLTADALAKGGTLGEVKLKYKTPDTGENREATLSIATEVYHETLTVQDTFIAAVVEFAHIMRKSDYRADASLESVVARLEALDFSDDEYKAEFREIVKKYMALVTE